jgi:hypothetical protein
MALFLGAEFRWLKRKLYREQRRFSSPQLVAAERSEVALRELNTIFLRGRSAAGRVPFSLPSVTAAQFFV